MKFECPFCGQWYECEPGFGEAICQKCNHTIFEKDVTPQEKPQSTKLMICPVCGGKRSTTALMCPHCGDKYTWAGRKPRSIKKGCITVFLLVLYFVLFANVGGCEFVDNAQKKGSDIPLLLLVFLPVLTAGGIATYFFMLPERINKK